MEEQTMEIWESRIMERLAEHNEEQLLDLTQDWLIRLASSLGSAKVVVRSGSPVNSILLEDIKRRCAHVAVLMDVLQLRYGDASDEEEDFLKRIEESMK